MGIFGKLRIGFVLAYLLFLSDCFMIIVIIRTINSIESFFKYTKNRPKPSYLLACYTFYTNIQGRWEAGVETFFYLFIFLFIYLFIYLSNYLFYHI